MIKECNTPTPSPPPPPQKKKKNISKSERGYTKDCELEVKMEKEKKKLLVKDQICSLLYYIFINYGLLYHYRINAHICRCGFS